ncbi:protein arginine N-methyltransferase 7 isoform X1 [Colletes gigas]|uniref:protein arginine N-methyltransferase 7 isoform X1 n=2 Tax=Colletes gigas TaxID=935657 RepID=UPI001C9AB069|nr:protein arginine N-methyltransferase 7 isoform X1 [Colletes gigas]
MKFIIIRCRKIEKLLWKKYMFRFPVSQLIVMRNMSIFTQCLNPLTGIITWEEKDENYDYHQEVARSAFADMLHDHERNEKYYVALKTAIERKHQTGEEANVIDIGTGTGLLSMMAAKCGADSVTACEAFTPMAKCAIKIIEENGFENKIKLIHKRSTKMTVGKDGDMVKKANILVTEVFDTELIGEGALSTFRHAHEYLLEENSIVVPHTATVWVQVVESPAIHAWNTIQPIQYKNKYLLSTPHCVKSCFGAAAVHDIQLTEFPRNAFKPLLPPQAIFRFDLSGKTPLQYDEKVCLRVKPTSTGTAHAIFMWWDLNMDIDNQVLLSCAPVWEHPNTKKLQDEGISLTKIADLIPWRDHWMQAIYYLPIETSVIADNGISLIGYHDEYSLWFQLINESISEIPDCKRPICSCGVHVAYCRTRIGQLNDEKRNEKYIKALEEKVTSETVCLCLSDSCLLSLAAIKLGAKKIFILETNFLSRKCTEMFIKANELSEKVHIIESVDDLPPENTINLIFGEPYFVTSIIPWENLYYWYLSSKYSSQVERIPIAATIMGVAVEFKDLHKIRAPLGICEGFDLSIFDKLVQASSEKSDSPIEAQPLWEYPAKALSLPFIIQEFDLTQNANEYKNINISNTVSILENGSCNGVALWVDWHLNSEITVSSGPTTEIQPGKRISWDPFTRQGVHLFRDITNVTQQNVLQWSFVFVPHHGNMTCDFHMLSKTMK